jgi:glycosyltransferase involved in cell wall biosynthesis
VRTTVVIPCYNEAERLVPDVFVAWLDAHADTTFLGVDDGSRDATGDVLDALAARHDRFRALRLEQNLGKAEAVRQGLLAAIEQGASVVGYWDADLATPLDAIDDLSAVLGQRPEVGFVLGSRVRLLGRHVERDALRHWFGRGTALAASAVLGLPIYDTLCGAKLLRPGTHADALFGRPFASRWAFDVELIGRWIDVQGGPDAARHTLAEVPLVRWTDVAGSKLRPVDFLRTPMELGRIAWLRGHP